MDNEEGKTKLKDVVENAAGGTSVAENRVEENSLAVKEETNISCVNNAINENQGAASRRSSASIDDDECKRAKRRKTDNDHVRKDDYSHKKDEHGVKKDDLVLKNKSMFVSGGSPKLNAVVGIPHATASTSTVTTTATTVAVGMASSSSSLSTTMTAAAAAAAAATTMQTTTAEMSENEDSFKRADSPGPKVPPLKIVIPPVESEQNNRNGKTATRHHGGLPYVVVSNDESGTTSPNSPATNQGSLIVKDEESCTVNLTNEEQRLQQRVLRSTHSNRVSASNVGNANITNSGSGGGGGGSGAGNNNNSHNSSNNDNDNGFLVGGNNNNNNNFVSNDGDNKNNHANSANSNNVLASDSNQHNSNNDNRNANGSGENNNTNNNNNHHSNNNVGAGTGAAIGCCNVRDSGGASFNNNGGGSSSSSSNAGNSSSSNNQNSVTTAIAATITTTTGTGNSTSGIVSSTISAGSNNSTASFTNSSTSNTTTPTTTTSTTTSSSCSSASSSSSSDGSSTSANVSSSVGANNINDNSHSNNNNNNNNKNTTSGGNGGSNAIRNGNNESGGVAGAGAGNNADQGNGSNNSETSGNCSPMTLEMSPSRDVSTSGGSGSVFCKEDGNNVAAKSKTDSHNGGGGVKNNAKTESGNAAATAAAAAAAAASIKIKTESISKTKNDAEDDSNGGGGSSGSGSGSGSGTSGKSGNNFESRGTGAADPHNKDATAIAAAIVPVVELHPRKRKLKSKQEIIHATTEPDHALNFGSAPHPHEVPVTNCYQMYMDIRRQIDIKRKGLFPIQPKPPQGFKDYLMNRCTYTLAGNSIPRLKRRNAEPPDAIDERLKDLYQEQEAERYSLRMQHVVEKEKLVLSVEQEILRVHGRAARALANQALPFSACTILKDEEVYNVITPEQEEKDRNARSRYNGRLFISWLQDVDDKWEKIKEEMLARHHKEAESLNAVQKFNWDLKMRQLGLWKQKKATPVEESHVPMISVSDDFDLLPE